MKRRAILFIMCMGLILTFSAVTALADGDSDAAKSAPEDLTLNMLSNMNRPAVMQVVVVHTLRVKSPDLMIDEKAYNKAYDKLYDMAVDGDITATYESLNMGMLLTMFDDPLTYYVPDVDADPLDQEVEITAMGTGFVIDPSGMVVTNAHVVDYDSEEILDSLIIEAIMQHEEENREEEENFSDRIDRFINDSTYWSEELSDLYTQALLSYYRKNMQSKSFETKIYVIPAGAEDTSDWSKKGMQARIICKGDPAPGLDLAILNVPDAVDMPTVPLAESPQVIPGDSVFVISYPGVATYDESLSTKSTTVPTLTNGVISGVKMTSEDHPVYQINADVTYGSSGSPVFNSEGEVVGVVAFGLTNETGTDLVSGMYYAYSVENLWQLIGDKASALKPAMNPLTYDYWDALNLMEERRYEEALSLFNIIMGKNSRYPYLQEMAGVCNTQIEAGNNVRPTPVPTPEPTPEPTPTPRWAGVVPAGGEILEMQELGVSPKAIISIGLLSAGTVVLALIIAAGAVIGIVALVRRSKAKKNKVEITDLEEPQDWAG